MEWLLILVLGDWFGNPNDLKIDRLPEEQCKAIVREVAPMKGKMGAGCFGPKGQVFTVDHVED